MQNLYWTDQPLQIAHVGQLHCVHPNVATYASSPCFYKASVQVQNALHRGTDKSLAQPTSRCILFDG